MKKVKLKVSRTDAKYGDIIEVPDDEAAILVERNKADLVEDDKPKRGRPKKQSPEGDDE